MLMWNTHGLHFVNLVLFRKSLETVMVMRLFSFTISQKEIIMKNGIHLKLQNLIDFFKKF